MTVEKTILDGGIECAVNVDIEFEDVTAYLEFGLTKQQCQEVYELVKDSVDIDDEVEMEHVERYIEHEATDGEKQTIFDLIENDIDLPEPEFEGIEISAKGLHDEMALDKVREYIEINGIQALAELI